MTERGAIAPVRGGGRLLAVSALAAVLAVAGWETAAGMRSWLRTPQAADLRALSQAVRAELAPGDLIATAPAWIDPVVRGALGDVMPTPMLGRPDAGRYGRIFEIGLGTARSEDTQGLSPEREQPFGAYTLRRYRKPAATVTFDAVARLGEARILQLAWDPRGPLFGRSGDSGLDGPLATPCPYQGPPLAACPPPRGPAGAFVCPQGRVERRTLEIAYRPRYGLSVTAGAGQVTELAWDAIPDSAWQGATLHLWLGLHDYHARKNAVGPAQVAVDLDGGQVQQTVSVTPRESEGALAHITLALPAAGAKAAEPSARTHSLRLRVAAEHAAHHHVGLIAELRR